MHALVTFAVGGDWPGAPDTETPFSATVEVDWLRVRQPADRNSA